MIVAYMCHPVGGDVEANLARAKLWLKWLTESRERPTAVIAPWITECEIWDDSNPSDREIGLSRCRAVIERCDEVYLVGGRISGGMDMERRHAVYHQLTVIDLTHMGTLPPGAKEPLDDDGELAAIIEEFGVPCSECAQPLGDKYYQGVPDRGDLCLRCHDLPAPGAEESPVAPSPTIDPAQLSPAVGKTAAAVEAMQASVRRATGENQD